MLFLRHTSPTGKERHYDALLAGLLGGYTVFGRTIHNSVSQQIVIYVFARVCLALAKLAVQPKHVAGAGGAHAGGAGGGGGGWELLGNDKLRHRVVKNGWPVFASVSWAAVMYLFRWHPETVQSSLRSSMSYMCVFPLLSFGVFFPWCVLMGESGCEITMLTVWTVMYNPTTGTRCGISSGTTNKRRPKKARPIFHQIPHRIKYEGKKESILHIYFKVDVYPSSQTRL